jgi:hypothetical protein
MIAVLQYSQVCMWPPCPLRDRRKIYQTASGWLKKFFLFKTVYQKNSKRDTDTHLFFEYTANAVCGEMFWLNFQLRPRCNDQ